MHFKNSFYLRMRLRVLITVDNYVDKCVENGGITMDF